MGLVQRLLGMIDGKDSAGKVDPYKNPYVEKLLHTVPVMVDGQEIALEIREIRNQQAKVMGAQSTFVCRGEKLVIIISSPQNEGFSAGVNIALPREIMSDFKEELRRLQEEGEASAGAKLSYNPETKNAILFRRADEKAGSLQKWRAACDENLQVLIDDCVACMPFVLGVYGE